MKKSLLLAAGMFAFAAAAQETTEPTFVAEALDGKTITLQCASGENQPCNEYFLVVNGTSLAGAADHGSNPYKWLVEYDATEQGVILSAGGYYIGRVPDARSAAFTLTQDKELAGRYRFYSPAEGQYCLTATKFVNGNDNATIGTFGGAKIGNEWNTNAIHWMQCTTGGIVRWASMATSSKWTYSVVEPDPVVEPEPQYTPEPGSYIRIGASTAGYYYDMTPGGNPCFSQNTNTAIYYYDANKRLVHFGEGRAATKTSASVAHELGGSTTAAQNADLNANAPEISFVACTDATVAGRYFVTWAYLAKNALLYCDQNGAIGKGSAEDAALQGLPAKYGPNWTFSIEDVTELPVKIGADGKGTMIVPVAVTVPASDDFTFYTASTNAEDKLVFSAVNAGATIPANTNIVIKRASTCTDATCNVTIATNTDEAEAAALAETSERFIGSYLATVAPTPAEGEVIYVKSSTLGESETAGENDVVFSKVAEGDVIPAGALAFKAKKNSEAEAPATLTLSLTAENSGTTTAINSIFVENEPANGAIYDLQGRRLSAPVKGINIIGGRKVLVK